uniref:Uncharacterized protein n=1 Tax=Vespula pensylvanica TaxID=30213 RepID=A0A834U7V0_VESPE|nr:hypothetical protein H0235_010588 [Vespula pensylvanica]
MRLKWKKIDRGFVNADRKVCRRAVPPSEHWDRLYSRIGLGDLCDEFEASRLIDYLSFFDFKIQAACPSLARVKRYCDDRIIVYVSRIFAGERNKRKGVLSDMFEIDRNEFLLNKIACN